MSDNDQLATRAVDALAAVRAIEADNSHPMRHNVRSLKRQAEQVLSDAFTVAHQLADLAGRIVADHDKATKEGGAA